MADTNEALDDLEKLISDTLVPKDDLASPPLDLEALGMQAGAKTRPRGWDNRGSGRRGG